MEDDEEIIRDFLHDFRLSAVVGRVSPSGVTRHEMAAAGVGLRSANPTYGASASSPVGALALGELCAAMEQAGKAGDAETLAALLPGFEQELASVEGFLGVLKSNFTPHCWLVCAADTIHRNYGGTS